MAEKKKGLGMTSFNLNQTPDFQTDTLGLKTDTHDFQTDTYDI